MGVTAVRPVPPELHKADTNPTGSRLGMLTLTALGVVYGDIGTMHCASASSPSTASRQLLKMCTASFH
jgi:K+ transporter